MTEKDDGRKYCLIEAPVELDAGDEAYIQPFSCEPGVWMFAKGTVLHHMVPYSYGFVQVAGPPED